VSVFSLLQSASCRRSRSHQNMHARDYVLRLHDSHLHPLFRAMRSSTSLHCSARFALHHVYDAEHAAGGARDARTDVAQVRRVVEQNQPMHVVPSYAQRSMGGLGPTAAADVLRPPDNRTLYHGLPVWHRSCRIAPETGATYRELIFLSCALQGTTGQRKPAEVQRDVLPGVHRPLAPPPQTQRNKVEDRIGSSDALRGITVGR